MDSSASFGKQSNSPESVLTVRVRITTSLSVAPIESLAKAAPGTEQASVVCRLSSVVRRLLSFIAQRVNVPPPRIHRTSACLCTARTGRQFPSQTAPRRYEVQRHARALTSARNKNQLRCGPDRFATVHIPVQVDACRFYRMPIRAGRLSGRDGKESELYLSCTARRGLGLISGPAEKITADGGPGQSRTADVRFRK